ncbi:hypothetical protein [Candidatus Palauibacter sp.]|uniref:hypothetical protein n=1 Tax=Candidatus Palauibacter sp. TaxID=3101350 RepID=UPI003B02C8C3
MITLENDRLHFRFPEVHESAHCSVSFQRTLRIPDDGTPHSLPPGLGGFPLRHVDDYKSRLPEEWLRRGGVLMPMHQAEAMWISFGSHSGTPDYPFAVKIATGKVCAVSGETWTEHLNRDPQDYVVLPDQPWIDGYCVEKGLIRQFVAMPLGKGYTVEEQITGVAEHGGIQIIAYPMKAERYEAILAAREARFADHLAVSDVMVLSDVLPSPSSLPRHRSMGLAPGGRMRQEIYDDPYGLDAWDQRHASRCFVTIANSEQWMAITGEKPPTTPPTAKQYADAGLPWFDYYDGDATAVGGAEKFADLASVAEIGAKKGETPLPENEPLTETRVVRLGRAGPRQVREPSLN